MFINNKSFAIITPVLNEHQYINFFLDDYFNLGFHRVYILIDDSTSPQDAYIIKPEHQDRVSLINLQSLYSPSELQNHLSNNNHKSGLVHDAIARVYMHHTTEDYCLVVGVDSFLYLNGRTIQQLFVERNITEDVGMVFFPWFVFLNNQTKEANYNCLNIMEHPKCPKEHNHHFFTLAQRKLVNRPSSDSHHYYIDRSVKAWYQDQTHIINPEHRFHDISQNILKIHCNSLRPQPCIIHIMARSINDIFIKYYHQWTKDTRALQQKKQNIYQIIVNNSKYPGHYAEKLGYLLKVNHHVEKCSIASNYNEFPVNFNEVFIKRILSECGISYDQYMHWLSKNNYTLY